MNLFYGELIGCATVTNVVLSAFSHLFLESHFFWGNNPLLFFPSLFLTFFIELSFPHRMNSVNRPFYKNYNQDFHWPNLET